MVLSFKELIAQRLSQTRKQIDLIDYLFKLIIYNLLTVRIVN